MGLQLVDALPVDVRLWKMLLLNPSESLREGVLAPAVHRLGIDELVCIDNLEPAMLNPQFPLPGCSPGVLSTTRSGRELSTGEMS